MVDKTERKKNTAMRIISNESCNISKFYYEEKKSNDSLNQKDIR